MKSKKVDNSKILVSLTRKSGNWSSVAADIARKQRFHKRKIEIKPTVVVEKPAPPAVVEAPKVDEESSKIWFDVDRAYLNTSTESSSGRSSQRPAKLTRAIGMDCEMVGVGENGRDSILARVSLVNQHGDCVYDKYVIPTERVVDYRTSVSGIRPDDLKKENNAIEFAQAQKDVSKIIEGRLLVGHALHNDLQVLYLSHPKNKIRDTQKCKLLRQMKPGLGGLCSLKVLAKELLGIDIQQGEHDSVKDAQVAMRIYMNYRKDWEMFLKNRKAGKNEKLVGHVQKETVRPSGELDDIDKRFDLIKGSENHQRYVKNKLKKRTNRPGLNKKSFVK